MFSKIKDIFKNKRNRYIIGITAAILCVVLLIIGNPGGQRIAAPAPAPESTFESQSEPEPESEPSLQPKTFADELSSLWPRIDGSTATIPLTEALYESLGDGKNAPPVHNTTSTAYENLIDGRSDLIFVTYPSPEELAAAEEKGDELEVIPVTRDALVFLVNIENPVENISKSQLRDIYQGKIKSWDEVGGLSESIIPYQRTFNSGSQTLMEKLLMDGRMPMEAPTEIIADTMQGLVDRVSVYDNARAALGYSMYYYVSNMYANSRFKLLSIDGVKPESESIVTGEYPFSDGYYAVVRKSEPADSPARNLIDWLLTDEGQTLAVSTGYIPLRPIEGTNPDSGLEPVYLGDYKNSSGTGGTVWTGWKANEDMLRNGEKRPLSDLFYDGFNYVEYINNKIFTELHSPDSHYTMKRSFPGIPNDYPNYSFPNWPGIVIEFPEKNPFFSEEGFTSIIIMLNKDISPYGSAAPEYSLSEKHTGQLMPDVDFFMLIVDTPNYPSVTKKINKTLQTWVDGFTRNTEAVEQIKLCREESGFGFYLYPETGVWKNYLSVSYCESIGFVYIWQKPVFYSICIDLNTGERVNLADKLPANIDYSKAAFLEGPCRITEDGRERDEVPARGYIPANGSVITNAMIGSGYIALYVTEPDGRTLIYVFNGDIFE